MEFYQNTTDFYIDGPCAVTLGKFDGFHRGHQVLLEELLKAGEQGFKTVVFTFGTNPRAQVTGKAEELLLTNEEKEALLQNKGIQVLIEYPFNDSVARMSPEDFVREVLLSRLHAEKIIVGSDFGFGYRRAGNVALLQQMSETCGYELVVKDKIKTKEGLDISSTYIKGLLKLGHMEQVNELLGYPYSVHGEVIHGNHYGRTFGMPTINQRPESNKLLPPNGVYVSKTVVDGEIYPSVTNIGVKPSIDGTYPKGVETFIHDFNRDIYGKKVEVQLYSYARPEMKFASKEELIAQMHRDNENARNYWKI
jgi:riboflavin kinase/FMN adenylyltransferase